MGDGRLWAWTMALGLSLVSAIAAADAPASASASGPSAWSAPVNVSSVDEVWRRQRDKLKEMPAGAPTGVTVNTYLDLAERIVRTAAPWQDRFGAVIDPYLHQQVSTTTPRFVGALGQLIGQGRCGDLLDACVRSYEHALPLLTYPALNPEFAVKELVAAHQSLRDQVEPARIANWEEYWRAYRAESCFGAVVAGRDHNYNTFGLVGEFARIQEGLGGDMALVERLLEMELRHLDANGMYRDPGCPLTYHGVVVQQWALLLMLGYKGRHYDAVSHAVRRGGLASLLMQSVTGQAPFGGRSNQYHHMEAQSAALFEACARLARADGDDLLAGAYKRAARRSVALITPWIAEMTPWRHLKQGFHPRLNHGNEAYGPYSVYGLLTASLLGFAARMADESIEERPTPAEMGGYVFATTPEFHQIVAHCGGWSIQINTKAEAGKDSTGLGRVQRIGLRPEAILAGSIPAEPAYTLAPGLPRPQRNCAIGPEWDDAEGASHRLADFSETIQEYGVEVLEQNSDRVAFEVTYRGEMGGVARVRERYELTPGGLRYGVALHPAPARARIVVPILESDGDATSHLAAAPGSLAVTYRAGVFALTVENGEIVLSTERNANRNAVYRTAVAASGRDYVLPTLRIR